MTTILTKKKDTAGAPAPGDLTNSAGGAELAVNTATKRLYTKDSGGNVVEIGTNPSAIVAASITDTGLTSGRVTYATTGGLLTDSANLTFDGTTFTSGVSTVISGTDNTNAMLRITQLGTGNALLVEDSANPDSTPFVIDASGKVVIGNTTTLPSPVAYPLQVVGSGSMGMTLSRFDANSTAPIAAFAKSRSATIGTFGTIVNSGDALGDLRFYGDDGVTAIEAARISAQVDGTPGTNDMPGRLVFSTTADGASTVTERMRIDSVGNVGIAASSTAGYRLLLGGVSAPSPSGNAYGVANSVSIQSDVTATYRSFRSSTNTQATAFTLSNLYHFDAGSVTIGAGSSLTNQVGFYAQALTGATNNYGFYGALASAANTYNLYMNGTADNYLAGSLGVGTAPLTTTKLYVTNTVTDTANAEHGIYSILTVNNASGSNVKIGNRSSIISGASFAGTNSFVAFRGDVTYNLSSAYTGSLQGFRTSIANNGAGAVSSVYGFVSTNTANTGGGSITNFYGFAQDDVTTATSAYGFLGSMASGSNKWNLYMSGTANNYLAGNLSIGTTTSTSMLLVAGSSSVSAIKTPNIAEVDTITATAATGTINYDVTTQSVLYYTSNASGNWTLNFRGSSGTSLNTLMQTGECISATFLVTQGSTAYYNSAVTIDGNSVTPKWQGGTAPTSGNASSVDCYTYVIQKTGSAAFTVLASQTKFA